MSLGSQIAWDDTVLPFQLDRSDIRGRVARLDGVLDQLLSRHDYPAAVEHLVAEAALLTSLIGQAIKLRWKLSLQIRGDGPVRVIATDYYSPAEPGSPARIRAWAAFDAERIDDRPPFEQIGHGYFAIMIDQGPGTTPYQGITPLSGGSLSSCAETYFAQSEQLPTRFALSWGRSVGPGGLDGWRAGGVMLQHMPKASPTRMAVARAKVGFWWRPTSCSARKRRTGAAPTCCSIRLTSWNLSARRCSRPTCLCDCFTKKGRECSMRSGSTSVAHVPRQGSAKPFDLFREGHCNHDHGRGAGNC
jgi:redox-regulated HSP33 family molecular chaperone